MFENIKIVFLDIDNTLTTPKKRYKVSVENKLAIKALQRKKVYVVLSTGRSRGDLTKVWNEIHLNEFSKYVIYANGAGVENILEREKIFENPIEEEKYNELINFAFKNNYFFILSGDETVWSNHHLNFFERIVAKFLRVKFKKYDKNFEINYSRNKIGMFVSLNRKKTSLAFEKIKKEFKDFEVTTSTKNRYIEITNKNISKAAGAERILDILKINKENTLAIGDSMNDYELFKLVGTSVVVKNGSKELKKIATYETKSAKRNGVAKILKEIN